LDTDEARRSWSELGIFVCILLLVAFLAAGAAFLLTRDDSPPAVAAPEQSDSAAGKDLNDVAVPAGLKVEPYKRPDPTLPAVPAGAVKRFRMQVYEHVTKVSDKLPATQVWSYSVNGVAHKGTGVSTPMVVEQGDKVSIELVNQTNESFKVDFPHSVDLHSAEVAPEEDYSTIGPGRTKEFRFTAKHPGVFMYHCATDPVMMHTGAGMVGAMIVKPPDLAPVDHELWITQQEYYLGPTPGSQPDMGKMLEEKPDAITFNGYADQYQKAPIEVGTGDSVRMFVMNGGPSAWSAFHVIGTVFDRTMIEGQPGHDAQTVNLAPSQGGWVEFSLDKPGAYPFVNHSFAAVAKGAAGAMLAK
jgi:nitrite reductase (NO-forming)